MNISTKVTAKAAEGIRIVSSIIRCLVTTLACTGFFAISVGVASADDPSPAAAAAAALPVSLTIPATTVRIGAPMPIHVEIRNQGSVPITLYMPSFGAHVKMHVVDLTSGKEVFSDPNAEERAYKGFMLEELVLQPGASWKGTFDLSHWIQFTSAGQYSLQVDLPHTAFTGPRAPVPLLSNVVRFSVVP